MDDMSGATGHFYPRSPCGERRITDGSICFDSSISIHALLAESDNSAYGALDGASISIHALLAESDSTTIITICTVSKFLSTLSLRRATAPAGAGAGSARDFYPRSPCGERLHDGRVNLFGFQHFYPRSPCGERQSKKSKTEKRKRFLSTLSLRRATAPRITPTTSRRNFYPRSPCGERPVAKRTTDIRPPFLSTLSLRRATHFIKDDVSYNIFLSTLSLRRATGAGHTSQHLAIYFYPRSPCGERHAADISESREASISIHALLAESDEPTAGRDNKNNVFLSTLSLRRATRQRN